MSYVKKVLDKVKINTVCACGFFAGVVGTGASISQYHDAHKGEPFVKVVSAQEARANEDDPKSTAALFFGAVTTLCAAGLVRKKDENDQSKPMDRFMYNMRDGLRVMD